MLNWNSIQEQQVVLFTFSILNSVKKDLHSLLIEI